ncbi:MAG: hypothetical protein KDC65_14165, partial [Saprospiraceae bacterium]|nr:hypothetical protein [Saprospiraceae bacterium]
MFPADKSAHVNPDTYLKLTFPGEPILHNTGKIRIYDAHSGELADELDLSIPPGPKNTRTRPPYDQFRYDGMPDSIYTVSKPDKDRSHVYQQNHIGGDSEADAYHFYPMLIQGNSAVICLHNNRLTYGKTYYVEVDEGVLSMPDGSPVKIKGPEQWTFKTKEMPPTASERQMVVASDGSGDFTTLQGAVDF